ncbi:MAG: hypothetical protein ACJ74W_18430 [Pyrinomonadaceae bacterium]
MPFRLRDLATVPSDVPDVEIFFSGQLLLRSEDSATCEVAVNQLATNHVLTIEVRTKVAGKPDIIRMRHVGPLNFRQREGMLIELSTSVASPAAWSCRTFDPINYESGDLFDPRDVPPKNPPNEDFRWILNLEGPLFHRTEFNPPIFNSHHVIRLRGGEYFFRTAMKASGVFDFKRTGGGLGDVRFKRIGAVARASVFLAPEGQAVVMKWQSLDQEREYVLTLEKGANTTHEIYINNSPLYLEPPPVEQLDQHDELKEFYKVLSATPIPDAARFKLVPALPLNLNSDSVSDSGLADSVASRRNRGEAGTPDIPCQVMTLDGANT